MLPENRERPLWFVVLEQQLRVLESRLETRGDGLKYSLCRDQTASERQQQRRQKARTSYHVRASAASFSARLHCAFYSERCG